MCKRKNNNHILMDLFFRSDNNNFLYNITTKLVFFNRINQIELWEIVTTETLNQKKNTLDAVDNKKRLFPKYLTQFFTVELLLDEIFWSTIWITKLWRICQFDEFIFMQLILRTGNINSYYFIVIFFCSFSVAVWVYGIYSAWNWYFVQMFVLFIFFSTDVCFSY